MSESGDFFVLFCATHVASNHANFLEQKLRTFLSKERGFAQARPPFHFLGKLIFLHLRPLLLLDEEKDPGRTLVSP